MDRARRGFTLVETMFAVALFSFAVAVVGPLLVRLSRQSNVVTGSQRRTAMVARATSRAAAIPFSSLATGCVLDTTHAFPNQTCTTLTDTAGALRRVLIVVSPIDSALSTPDSVVLYRVNPLQLSPFNSP